MSSQQTKPKCPNCNRPMPEWKKPFEYCAPCTGANTQGKGYYAYLKQRLSEIKSLESITGSTGMQFSRATNFKSRHANDNE